LAITSRPAARDDVRQSSQNDLPSTATYDVPLQKVTRMFLVTFVPRPESAVRRPAIALIGGLLMTTRPWHKSHQEHAAYFFVGDIGRVAGRQIVRDDWRNIVAQRQVDLVIANGENSASGFGITPRLANSC